MKTTCGLHGRNILKAKFLCFFAVFIAFTSFMSCGENRMDNVGYVSLSNENVVLVEEVEVPEIVLVEEQDLREFYSVEKMVFPLPIKYRNNITSPQGFRDAIPLPGGGSTLPGLHNAIDIACPDKTDVYAAKDGVFEEVWPSYYNGGKAYKGDAVYGGKIVIAHYDGTKTLYGHLSYTMPNSIEGTEVKQGTVIGWSGGVKGRRGSGSSTGPHLHFAEIIMIEDQFY